MIAGHAGLLEIKSGNSTYIIRSIDRLIVFLYLWFHVGPW